ncbi:MAG: sigma 54-interacting transcriptional regulator [Nitrospirae bacterium]|nr:sigma 54-interacting transcriptional regulator [Nitrospirota bacterium]
MRETPSSPLSGASIALSRPWLVLKDVIESISHGKSEQEVLDIIFRELQGIVPFDRIGVATVDEPNERIVMTSLRTEGTPEIPVGYAGKLKDSTLEPLMKEGRVRIINDLQSYMEKKPGSDSTRRIVREGMISNLTLPLLAGGRPIGVMFFSSRRKDAYKPAHADLVREIAGQMATAVENGRLMDALNKRNRELEGANAQLALTVRKLEETIQLKEELQQENIYLKDEITTQFSEIVGSSPALTASLSAARRVAITDSTVLITGETGTGKELVARAIHVLSSRRDRALIKVNCSSLPETLIESELFGHEKGAFTGAIARKPGRFELASGGTLFLDEVVDIPPTVQVKLLRALQEKEIERVGGSQPIKVDVRIIAATNRPLEPLVTAGQFREDLFYRLNVFPIHLPPLRERKEDLAPLTNHFIRKFALKMSKRITEVSPRVMDLFMAYEWPGNVREIEHLLERAVILCDGHVINDTHINFAHPRKSRYPQGFQSLGEVDQYCEEIQRNYLRQILRSTNGKIYGTAGAAKVLNLKPTTLQSRLAKLGVSARDLK